MGLLHRCEEESGLRFCSSKAHRASWWRGRRSSREPRYSSPQKDPRENIWCVLKCTHNIYLKYRL